MYGFSVVVTRSLALGHDVLSGSDIRMRADMASTVVIQVASNMLSESGIHRLPAKYPHTVHGV